MTLQDMYEDKCKQADNLERELLKVEKENEQLKEKIAKFLGCPVEDVTNEL